MSKSDQDIEIFHRVNKLKSKAGVPESGGAVGVISSEKINKAQGIINQKELEYPVEVQEILKKLQSNWQAYLKADDEGRKDFLEKIYNYSNNIKDLTSMYKHDLMSHFSLSLRDFCEKIDINKKEHQIIVQAHIDVMLVTFQEQLRSDKTEKAEELKNIVGVAIKKYS